MEKLKKSSTINTYISGICQQLGQMSTCKRDGKREIGQMSTCKKDGKRRRCCQIRLHIYMSTCKKDGKGEDVVK